MRCSLLLALGGLVAASASAQPTIVVNTLTAASGDHNPSDGRCDVDAGTPGDQCTFYAALAFANSFTDPPSVPVRITFALAGTPPVFEVRGFTLVRPVELDCSTQPGSQPGYPQIAIQNTGFESSVFTLRGGRSTIRGCAFPFAPTSILTFVDGGHNVVEGNTFGLNRDGTTALGDGIVQAVNLNVGSGGASNGNRVGGPTAAQRNIFGRFGSEVSGLSGRGVLVGSDSNVVVGNWFGMNPDGTETRPGFGPAIQLYLEASNNQIGQDGAGNLLGKAHGIVIGANSPRGTAALKNQIEGNILGFLPATLATVANPVRTGILVNAFDGGRAQETTIRRNIVGGFEHGVRLSTDQVSSTIVAENRIGTTPDGGAAHGNTAGLTVEGGTNTVVQGNLVSGNTTGVLVQRGSFSAGPSGVVIIGNLIGTNETGTASVGNGTGILVSTGAGGVQIGGRVGGTANIISGNRFDGIHITSGSTGGSTIEGNAIGLNGTGTAALPNGGAGILLSSARNNTLGGAAAGAGNVISGNARSGIQINGSGSTGNLVLGNWIGLSGDGRRAIGNGQFAVQLVEAPDNIIGLPDLGARNTISGNSGGLYIQQSPRTIVFGNRFGVDAVGGGRLPNNGPAITVFQSNDVKIGTLSAAAGNHFAFHLHTPAVTVLQSTGVAVLSNTFDRNGMGIDLDGDGLTANDPADPDAGANRRMNSPVIASASLNRSTGNLDVTYSVDAASSNATYSLTVQFFLADSTGAQGAYFLATDTYTFPNTTRSVSLPTGLGAEFITDGRILATATDGADNTSEFSPSVAAVVVAAEDEAVPAAFALGRPSPQPAAGAATFAVALPHPGRLRVDVFDLLGRRVASPYDGDAAAGQVAVRVDTRGWAPGTYLVRAEAAGQVLAQTLVVR